MIRCRRRTQKLRTGDTGEEREGTGGQLFREVTLVTAQDWLWMEK